MKVAHRPTAKLQSRQSIANVVESLLVFNADERYKVIEEILTTYPSGERRDPEIKKLQQFTSDLDFFKNLKSAKKNTNGSYSSSTNYLHSRICQRMNYQSCKKGRAVIEMDARADRFFILLRGSVQIFLPKSYDSIMENIREDARIARKQQKDSKITDHSPIPISEMLLQSGSAHARSKSSFMLKSTKQNFQEAAEPYLLEEKEGSFQDQSPQTAEQHRRQSIQVFEEINFDAASHAYSHHETTSEEDSKRKKHSKVIQMKAAELFKRLSYASAKDDSPSHTSTDNHQSAKRSNFASSMQSGRLGSAEQQDEQQQPNNDSPFKQRSLSIKESLESLRVMRQSERLSSISSQREYMATGQGQQLEVDQAITKIRSLFADKYAQQKIFGSLQSNEIIEPERYTHHPSLIFKYYFLKKLETGSCFGELGLLDSKPRTAMVMCAEDCEFLVLQKADYEELLSNMLPDINKTELKPIISFFERRKLIKGEQLFKQQDISDGVYLIYKGDIQLFKAIDKRKEEVVPEYEDALSNDTSPFASKASVGRRFNTKQLLPFVTLSKGEYFGEEFILFDDSTKHLRSYSAITSSLKATVYFITQQSFLDILQEKQELMVKFSKAVQIKIERRQDFVESISEIRIEQQNESAAVPAMLKLSARNLKRCSTISTNQKQEVLQKQDMQKSIHRIENQFSPQKRNNHVVELTPTNTRTQQQQRQHHRTDSTSSQIKRTLTSVDPETMSTDFNTVSTPSPSLPMLSTKKLSLISPLLSAYDSEYQLEDIRRSDTKSTDRRSTTEPNIPFDDSLWLNADSKYKWEKLQVNENNNSRSITPSPEKNSNLFKKFDFATEETKATRQAAARILTLERQIRKSFTLLTNRGEGNQRSSRSNIRSIQDYQKKPIPNNQTASPLQVLSSQPSQQFSETDDLDDQFSSSTLIARILKIKKNCDRRQDGYDKIIRAAIYQPKPENDSLSPTFSAMASPFTSSTNFRQQSEVSARSSVISPSTPKIFSNGSMMQSFSSTPVKQQIMQTPSVASYTQPPVSSFATSSVPAFANPLVAAFTTPQILTSSTVMADPQPQQVPLLTQKNLSQNPTPTEVSQNASALSVRNRLLQLQRPPPSSKVLVEKESKRLSALHRFNSSALCNSRARDSSTLSSTENQEFDTNILVVGGPVSVKNFLYFQSNQSKSQRISHSSNTRRSTSSISRNKSVKGGGGALLNQTRSKLSYNGLEDSIDQQSLLLRFIQGTKAGGTNSAVTSSANLAPKYSNNQACMTGE